VSNDSGVIENIDFRDFGCYVFGTLGNEVYIIMYYYLVRCRLSSDPEIYDLERPFDGLFGVKFCFRAGLAG